ncbi:MAG TPA: CHAT domain-containing tetratricopeptide repeat protein [Candidatus Angelobacter sp.]|nr:CHAT domain-containing tetratricopeptide repeat protein [Candidatus Angelobacter sp.]
MAKKNILYLSAILLFASAGGVCQQPASGPFKAQMEKAKELRAAGSSDEARKIYESVLPPLRTQAPSHELIDALNNLSDIATMSGEYTRAVALSRESATACQKMQDKNCEAQAYDDAGLALSNAGNYAEAAAELDLALKLTAETGNAQTAVLILNNLGSVYFYQAKYSEALRTYESALQYVEKAGAEPWVALWRQLTQLNLATLYQRLGNDQRAIKIYNDILAHPNKDLTPRDVAHVDANMGAIYRRLGDPKQALDFYGYADEYYAKEKDIDGELGVLKNSGIVLALELSRFQDALKTFDRVRTLAEKTKSQREAMQAVLYRGETLYRMGKLEDAQKEFAAALAAAEQLGTVEEQWKAVYKIGKIALDKGQREIAEAKFRDAIQRIESLRSQLQLSRLKTDFLADKRDVYNALIKLLLERNDAPGAFEFMERSRARVFQDRFFGGQLAPGSLSLQSIQARLDPQTTLIEFWAGSDGVAAVWVTRDSAGIAQSHFSEAEMGAFAQVVSQLPDVLGDDWQRDFHKIGSMLAKELAPLTQDRFSHVLIVPDGFLSLIPFELLPTAPGKPLLESRDVTYMPSAVLLLRGALQNASATRLPWQQQLVGFGDPAVIGGGESSLTSAPRGEIPGSLPASGEEIRGIARMSAGRTRLFLGAEDRKQAFFDSARSGAALLHVSTHAVADMDDPERSRLLFSPDEPGQPNNYLFLKELYDLDLRGMSLATLSACDTERGSLVPGEGIQAFSRVLLAAGSRSALTTLWRVPDGPTSEFMQHFYFYLLKKRKSKAEALRLTKLEFLHSGTALSHPRYWAAFVLNGDGTEPVPRFIPWQALAIPVLIIAFALFIYLRVRRKKTLAAQAA